MKKKLIRSVIFVLIMMMCLALAACAGGQIHESDASSTEAEVSAEETTEEAEGAETEEAPLISENGMFDFTAKEFRDRFAENLPKGFVFADQTQVSASQDKKIQLNILDDAGNVTDMAILMDAEDEDASFKQMALVIKEGWFEEDVSAVLNWYITNFFEEFDEKEKLEIHEEYFKIFTERTEDYSVYGSESCDVMMMRNTEETGNFYYIMISISY